MPYYAAGILDVLIGHQEHFSRPWTPPTSFLQRPASTHLLSAKCSPGQSPGALGRSQSFLESFTCEMSLHGSAFQALPEGRDCATSKLLDTRAVASPRMVWRVSVPCASAMMSSHLRKTFLAGRFTIPGCCVKRGMESSWSVQSHNIQVLWEIPSEWLEELSVVPDLLLRSSDGRAECR